jgi:hypothetical protein
MKILLKKKFIIIGAGIAFILLIAGLCLSIFSPASAENKKLMLVTSVDNF